MSSYFDCGSTSLIPNTFEETINGSNYSYNITGFTKGNFDYGNFSIVVKSPNSIELYSHTTDVCSLMKCPLNTNRCFHLFFTFDLYDVSTDTNSLLKVIDEDNQTALCVQNIYSPSFISSTTSIPSINTTSEPVPFVTDPVPNIKTDVTGFIFGSTFLFFFLTLGSICCWCIKKKR